MFVALNAIGVMNLLMPSELVQVSVTYYNSFGMDLHLLPLTVSVLCLVAAPHVYMGSCWRMVRVSGYGRKYTHSRLALHSALHSCAEVRGLGYVHEVRVCHRSGFPNLTVIPVTSS